MNITGRKLLVGQGLAAKNIRFEVSVAEFSPHPIVDDMREFTGWKDRSTAPAVFQRLLPDPARRNSLPESGSLLRDRFPRAFSASVCHKPFASLRRALPASLWSP